MLTGNYDEEEHFTVVIQKVLDSQFKWLTYAILREKGGRTVRWENKTGIHEYFIPRPEKEELFELINTIAKTEK